MRHLTSALILSIAATCASAAPLRIAVTSDFETTFAALADAYHKSGEEQLDPSYGATGTLYQQIVAGAPFAALFAADDQRTAQLVDAGRARPASRFIYAIGHLTLWVPGAASAPDPTWLGDAAHRIAIADPQLCPYGLAAEETLTKMSLWNAMQGRLVVGADDDQTLQSLANGRVAGGFVARAQLIAHFHGAIPDAQVWHVPESMHAPIIHEAVALNTPDAQRVESFFSFVASADGRAIVEAGGYSVLAPVKPPAP